MSKRRHSGPPLYDLISHPTRQRAVSSSSAFDDSITTTSTPMPVASVRSRRDAHAGERRNDWLRPGRPVSVPVGYLLVASAIAATLVVGAYVFGYERAQTNARAEFEADWRSRIGGENAGAVPNDPLAASNVGMIGLDGASQSNGPQRRSAGTDDRREASGGRPSGATSGVGAGWGPVESDPRVSGSQYFVLMETLRQGAVRLAEFLRGQNLEAYVVPISGSKLKRVIVLPALSSSSKSNPQVIAMRQRIDAAGALWKRNGASNDLSDAYIRSY